MELPQRKNIRLQEYDYSSAGAYFVTFCTHNRKHTLSKVLVGDGSPVPKLTASGLLTEKLVLQISEHFPSVIVDKYVIMPNHVHVLLFFSVCGEGTGDPSPTLGNVVGWLKYQATKAINEKNDTKQQIWQRSYYDHVIRNQQDYDETWTYIENNPAQWAEDEYYCEESR